MSILSKTKKRQLQKFVNKFGIHVGGYIQPPLLKLLNKLDIDLIIDVGANEGQYGLMVFDMGYKGRVLSFEPMTEPYQKLWLKSQNFTNWEVAPRCALGSSRTQLEINISNNSISSSLLPILDTHTNMIKDAKYIGTEIVEVNTLDNLDAKYFKDANNIFLKIDVQGYEYEVLKGAETFLNSVKGIQVELTIEPLYKNGILWQQMIQFLAEKGYKPYYFIPFFFDHTDGHLLQMDGLFMKSK